VLERQERVIVVAAEGVGKTTLARQVAICTAAGIHPFTRSGMAPITTLFVDLENPERIIRRMSKQIVGAAEHYRPRKGDPINAHLLMKPDGMNLLGATDRVILEETIEKTKPDLLVIGPLYKAFIDPGGRTSESVAVEIAKYLDYIRWTYDCALWMEHHAPLGGSGGRDMRPFGSAVWSRWPEFGLTIEPDGTNTELSMTVSGCEWGEVMRGGGGERYPFNYFVTLTGDWGTLELTTDRPLEMDSRWIVSIRADG
jgi:replicative DNA helicase